jgi:hypothetical protein
MLDSAMVRLAQIYANFPVSQSPNESQTEDDLIWPMLAVLGWTISLRQQNLAPRGREDVPDGLLFKDAGAKTQANRTPEEWRRYDFGLAVVESKRWNRPLAACRIGLASARIERCRAVLGCPFMRPASWPSACSCRPV